MKALKSLVIGMGILILLGLGVVVAALISGVNDTSDSTERRTVTLDVPAACRVARMTAVDGRLALRLTGPEGAACPALVLLDADTGAVHTTIRTAPGARATDRDGPG